MLPEGYIQSNYWPDDYWHEDYFPFGSLGWYKIALEGHDADFLDVTATDVSISAPVLIYSLSHDSFTDFVAAEHIDWSVTGAEDIHNDRIPSSSVTQHMDDLVCYEDRVVCNNNLVVTV